MSDWASALNERVAIKQPVRTADGLGGQEVVWETLAYVWAQVEPVGNMRAREAAAQREGQAGYRVRIRYRPGINASLRLLWRTRTLIVHAVHEQEAILEILAYEEGV